MATEELNFSIVFKKLYELRDGEDISSSQNETRENNEIRELGKIVMEIEQGDQLYYTST